MAGASRDYFQGTDAITLAGSTFRPGLTLDASNANYPDLIRAPAGCYFLEIVPGANLARVRLEGVDAATNLSAAQDGTAAGSLVADKGGLIPVQPGQYVAIFSATVGTVYDLGFYERTSEKV